MFRVDERFIAIAIAIASPQHTTTHTSLIDANLVKRDNNNNHLL